MKIKRGFVSNSSSTSFIIASKGEEQEAVARRIGLAFSRSLGSTEVSFSEYDARTLAEQYFDHEDTKVMKTEKDLKEYFEDVCYDYEDAIATEWGKTFKKAIDAGLTIWRGSMPDYGEGGDALTSMLRSAKIRIFDEKIMMMEPCEDDEEFADFDGWIGNSDFVKDRETYELIDAVVKANDEMEESMRRHNDMVHEQFLKTRAESMKKMGREPDAWMKGQDGEPIPLFRHDISNDDLIDYVVAEMSGTLRPEE
jgi:hypothetical protein